MRNVLFIIMIFFAFSVDIVAKDPVDNDAIYVGGGLAIQTADNLDSGVGLILKGGFPFKDLNDGPGNLGAEVEFSYSLISPSKNSYEVDFLTLGAYGTYTYDFYENFYAKGRVGLVYYSTDKSSYSDDGMELSVGIGAGYKFSKNINFYLDHTVVDDLSNFAFGVEYKLSSLK